MPDINPAPRPSDPAALIRAATRAIIATGIPVTTKADLGVVCSSTLAPTWERDPGYETVSPLGAVLLAHQPPIPVADQALAHVLGVGPVWVLGFDDGVSGGDPGASSIVRGPAVRLYGDGFRAGAEFRACDGVPFPRPSDEVTEPIPLRAPALVRAGHGPAGLDRDEAATLPTPGPGPKTLLQQLLSSLTIAQALEAIAETVPARGWDNGDKADVTEDLRDMATCYRDLRL